MNRGSQALVSKTMTRRCARLGVVLILLVGSAPAWAQTVAPALRAAVLVSALGYEQSIRDGEGPIRLVIVSDAAGQRDGDAMLDAFRGIASRARLAGRAIQLRRVNFAGDVQAALRGSPHVVYIANGTQPANARQIIDRMSQGQVAVCGDGGLSAVGCALGVEAHANRARPVIAVGTARQRGLSFQGRLLRSSRVIP